MNCRNCGAQMTFVWDLDYFFCDYCKTYDFPEEGSDSFRIVDKRSGLHCPACSAELQVASFLKMRALHCGNCRGFLMKQDRFRILVGNLRAGAADAPAIPEPIDREELQRQVRCPHCFQVMDTHVYGGPGERRRQLPPLHGHLAGSRRAEKNQGRSGPRPRDAACARVSYPDSRDSLIFLALSRALTAS